MIIYVYIYISIFPYLILFRDQQCQFDGLCWDGLDTEPVGVWRLCGRRWPVAGETAPKSLGAKGSKPGNASGYAGGNRKKMVRKLWIWILAYSNVYIDFYGFFDGWFIDVFFFFF